MSLEKETAAAEVSGAKDLLARSESAKESRSSAFAKRKALAKFFQEYKHAIGRKVYENNIQWEPGWERKMDWIGLTCAFRRCIFILKLMICMLKMTNLC